MRRASEALRAKTRRAGKEWQRSPGEQSDMLVVDCDVWRTVLPYVARTERYRL